MFAMIFKKLTGFDMTTMFIVIMLALIALIAIPNAGRIMNMFGFETKEQIKEQRDAARSTLEVAVQTNDLNLKDTRVLQDTTKITEDVIVNKVENDKVIDTKVIEIKERKEKKAGKIAADPSTTPQAQADQNSEVQITSVWDAYCSFNQSNQCPANGTAQGA